jgi:glycosyltransferase involved in cell wall biosynthesis
METYTLGLFANMYPAFEGDYRGIFIQQMVRDLEARGVTVKKAVKISPSVTDYFPFYWQSLLLARDKSLDILQAEYIPHSSLVPAYLKRNDIPLILKFHGDDGRIFPFENTLFMALTRAMIRHADYIITSSEEIRTTLISIGAHPEKSAAIHTGVDTEFFHPVPQQLPRNELGLTDDFTTFVFIGRMHP